MRNTISRAVSVLASIVAIGRRSEYDRPQVSADAHARARSGAGLGRGARAVRFRHRIEQAEARADRARAEADVSRERLAYVREHVVEPLKQAGEHNQFAQMIADSLREGHHR